MLNSSFLSRCFVMSVVASGLCVRLAAEEQMRTWMDKTGKFKIEARLIERNDHEVKLIKSDGKAIAVPLSRLSDQDRTYLDSLADETNPFEGGETVDSSSEMKADSDGSLSDATQGEAPQGEAQELPADGPQVLIDYQEALPTLKPDPMIEFPVVTPFVRGMDGFDAYVKLSQPFVADRDATGFLVSAFREPNASADLSFGVVYKLTKQSKQPQIVYKSKDTFQLVEHDPRSDISLGLVGIGGPDPRGGQLVLIQGLAAGSPRVTSRWELPGHSAPGFKPKVEWAKLLNKEQALIEINDNVYRWNLRTGECLFQVKVTATADCKVSAGGLYLAIPETGGCKLVDVTKGELIGSIQTPIKVTPDVAFSPDGTKLAFVGSSDFCIWNLETAQMEMEEVASQHLGSIHGWVSNHELLTSFFLLDLNSRVPIWSYNISAVGQSLTLPNSLLIAKSDTKISTLTVLPVPHKSVEKARVRLKNVTPAMLAVPANATVAVTLNASGVEDQPALLAALSEAVEKAGWTINANAPIQVVATIEQGAPQSMTFRQLIGGPNRESQTVSVRPYAAKVEVMVKGESVWSTSTSNMMSALVQIKPGQSLEDAVRENEKPDPSYLTRITFPHRILKKEVQSLIMTSRIDQGTWVDY